jgi:hypothetical protein
LKDEQGRLESRKGMENYIPVAAERHEECGISREQGWLESGGTQAKLQCSSSSTGCTDRAFVLSQHHQYIISLDSPRISASSPGSSLSADEEDEAWKGIK